MAKNYVEYQRFGISKAKFDADIRFALKKHSVLSGWEAQITPELGTLDAYNGEACDFRSITDDGEDILRVSDGTYYSRFVPTEVARVNGITGYTFNYEFTYDDDKTGHGYLYLVVF